MLQLEPAGVKLSLRQFDPAFVLGLEVLFPSFLLRRSRAEFTSRDSPAKRTNCLARLWNTNPLIRYSTELLNLTGAGAVVSRNAAIDG